LLPNFFLQSKRVYCVERERERELDGYSAWGEKSGLGFHHIPIYLGSGKNKERESGTTIVM
jgi:hypothetical protein